MPTQSSRHRPRPALHQRATNYNSSDDDLTDESSSSSSYERLPPRTPTKDYFPSHHQPEPSPAVHNLASDSNASVATYNSLLSSTEFDFYGNVGKGGDGFGNADKTDDVVFPEDAVIPTQLPAYSHHPLNDYPVRPTTPQAFSQLFPSLDRLSILHDDFTPDGNMNLRVETPVLLPRSRHHRPVAFQLFHLRLHDLAMRDFSLRRYCRGSGREVCNSKRTFVDAAASSSSNAACHGHGRSNSGGASILRRPSTLQRSVSKTIRSVKTPFQRASTSTASSGFRRPGTGGRRSSVSSGSSHSWNSAIGCPSTDGLSKSLPPTSSPNFKLPTDTIKLEFSNYARVDVSRRSAATRGSNSGSGGGEGQISYDFEWWGHRYAWQRSVDRHTGVVTFHLIRDGRGYGIAHIVPETRGLEEARAEERAGGWIPPCHFWISDESVLRAMTDVADVIIATGLIALVDSSIRTRWAVVPPQKRPGHPAKSFTGDFTARPRSLIPSFFQRRNSEQTQTGTSAPLNVGRPVTAY